VKHTESLHDAGSNAPLEPTTRNTEKILESQVNSKIPVQ